MRVSFNWLKEYLPTELTVAQVAEVLTGIGLEVENYGLYSSVPGGLEGLLVGHVLTCEPHPDSDHMHVTTVDVGQATPLQIVCGAPNVAVGQKVVVAPVGTTIHPLQGEEVKLKKAKLRGVVSEGMLCAEDEVGLGASHEGILVLPREAKPGIPVRELYPELCDYVLEIGLTANRADAMSLYGVARDLAAYLNQTKPTKATLPAVALPPMAHSATQLELGRIDPKACVRYAGLTLRHVSVGPSPDWMQHRLKSLGINPIDNVVDITNYVMLELGQPLHAFDAQAFSSGRVEVGFCPQGTPFVTLDGQAHTLQADDITILDAGRPQCLAGIYGGKASGITENTHDVFLESAVFDAHLIRRSAKCHGLSTEASFRFERGVDPAFTRLALERAASLLIDLAGAQVDGEVVDCVNQTLQHEPFDFTLAWLNAFLGLRFDVATVENLFQGLEIEYTRKTDGVWRIRPPYYRVDVMRPVDVAEELLRLYGYDRVPLPAQLQYALPTQAPNQEVHLRNRLAANLAGAGLHEIQTNTLVAGERVAAIEAFPQEQLVHVENPLSRDLNVLRPTLLFGALDTVARNVARQRPALQLFEFGHVFTTQGRATDAEKPLAPFSERNVLGITLTGDLAPENWVRPARKSSPFTLKGYVERILELVGLDILRCQSCNAPQGLYEAGESLSLGKHLLVHYGAVSTALLKLYDLKQPVFYAELDWEQCAAMWAVRRDTYTELPRFFEVRRDLALLLDKDVPYARVEQVIRKQVGKLLRHLELFDVYEGDKLPEGKVSCAVMLILQSPVKTLDEALIENTMRHTVEALRKELGAELRQ